MLRIEGPSEQARTILMFSHIPKTAGTTFNVLLRRYFGSSLLAARVREDATRSTYRYIDLVRDLRVYPRLRCVSGHGIKPFEDFRELEGRLQWFTFLREPVARFISHYVHQQTGDHPQFRMSLQEWTTRFNRRNWCVRMLAGEEDVKAAQQILKERIAFMGLVEHFDLSVKMFCQRFGLVDFNSTYTERKTISRNPGLRDELLASVREYDDIVQENTQLDCQLYEFAIREIWEHQLAGFQQHESSPCDAPKSTFVSRLNYVRWALKDRIVYQPFVKLFG